MNPRALLIARATAIRRQIGDLFAIFENMGRGPEHDRALETGCESASRRAPHERATQAKSEFSEESGWLGNLDPHFLKT